MSIYGKYEKTLDTVMHYLADSIAEYNRLYAKREGSNLYEHLGFRVKSDSSMREKCTRKGLPQNEKSALCDIKDAIGLRIVTRFGDDIFKLADYIKTMENCTVVKEKDFVTSPKPNGYRSYHIILAVTVPYEDALGNNPGIYYAEIQIRTIAMDSWAALEHEMTYKKDIGSRELISSELRRCADELASCDITMQTIRDLIREG
ncbi:MAG: GTP pyrophosphokinase family protein [Ruminococcaceae bacterium]|nr:GTP pyrophosphokinase family protein [Oscillospiraceae bacterium]